MSQKQIAKIETMNTVVTDIWPYLLTALLGVVGAYARYVHNLKERVAVLEQTIEDQQKTLDNMQKRMDSHSKKQDDILDRITNMEKEVLKQMGTMATNIASLASDLKGLNNLLAISDVGIKINRA